MAQDIKEYRNSYYKEHKEELKAKKKAWYQAHKEEQKARCKAWQESHKEEYKNYQKEWQETHKEEMKEWNKAHREELNARAKAWREAHKEESRAYYRNYNKAYYKDDVNSSGQTKHSIRCISNQYLNKHGTKIPGYQIHHCCTYDEPFKFIYCNKEIHRIIHEYLREHNIDADSNHYEQIKHLLDETVVLYGLE